MWIKILKSRRKFFDSIKREGFKWIVAREWVISSAVLMLPTLFLQDRCLAAAPCRCGSPIFQWVTLSVPLRRWLLCLSTLRLNMIGLTGFSTFRLVFRNGTYSSNKNNGRHCLWRCRSGQDPSNVPIRPFFRRKDIDANTGRPLINSRRPRIAAIGRDIRQPEDGHPPPESCSGVMLPWWNAAIFSVDNEMQD